MNCIFDARIESDLTEFDGTVGSVAYSATGLVGTSGKMAVTVTPGNKDYTYVNIDPGNIALSTRWYFDPNSLTMADGDAFVLLSLVDDSNTEVAYVRLLKSGVDYQLDTGMVDDNGTIQSIASFTITDAEHYIEFVIRRSFSKYSIEGAYIKLHVDGVEEASVEDFQNWQQFADITQVQFGALGTVDAGTSGTIHFDEIIIRDDFFLPGSWVAAAAPETIWFATDGNDTTGDGSEITPYATIDKAITEATGPGTTIKGKSGDYTWPAPSALTKSGQADADFIIECSDPNCWIVLNIDNDWTIEGDWVTLRNIVLTGAGTLGTTNNQNGLRLGRTTLDDSTRARQIILDGVISHRNTKHGLMVRGADYVLAKHCEFSANRQELDIASGGSGADGIYSNGVIKNFLCVQSIFIDNAADGVQIDAITSENVRFVNCLMALIRGTTESTIRPWRSYCSGKIGENPGPDCKEDDIEIHNCVIYGGRRTSVDECDLGAGGDGGGAAIWHVSANGGGAYFSQVWDCNSGLSAALGGGAGVSDIRFIGNIYHSPPAGADGRGGISMAYTTNAHVIGNTIIDASGSGQFGLRFKNCVVQDVKNNYFENCNFLDDGGNTYSGAISNNAKDANGTWPAGWGSITTTAGAALDNAFAPGAGSSLLSAGTNVTWLRDLYGSERPNPPAIGAAEQLPAVATNIIVDMTGDRSLIAYPLSHFETNGDSRARIEPGSPILHDDYYGQYGWRIWNGGETDIGYYSRTTFADGTALAVTDSIRIDGVVWMRGMIGGDNDEIEIVDILDGGANVSRIRLRYENDNGGWSIVPTVKDNNGGNRNPNNFRGHFIGTNITHFRVEIEYQAGAIRLYLGSTAASLSLIAENTGLSLDTREPDEIRFGQSDMIDADNSLGDSNPWGGSFQMWGLKAETYTAGATPVAVGLFKGVNLGKNLLRQTAL